MTTHKTQVAIIGSGPSGLLLGQLLTLAGIALARDEFETTGMARKLARYHAHPQSMFRGWNDIWLDPAFRNWNIEHYLDSIRDPVLLLQSRDDPYGTLAQVDAIAHRAGGAVQKILFAGSSHSPHVDFREETLAGITRFLGSLGPSHPKQ